MPGPLGWSGRHARHDHVRRGRRGVLPAGRGLVKPRVDLQQLDTVAPAILERLQVRLIPGVPPELLDHELHAVALLVLVVAVDLEDAQRSLRRPAESRTRAMNS